MLIEAENPGTKSLTVGNKKFAAVAPGIFEVPEAIGRTLSTFPHFDVASRPLSDYLPEPKQEQPKPVEPEKTFEEAPADEKKDESEPEAEEPKSKRTTTSRQKKV